MQSKLNVRSDGRNVCATMGLYANLKRKQKIKSFDAKQNLLRQPRKEKQSNFKFWNDKK